jgi:hypothetical protein
MCCVGVIYYFSAYEYFLLMLKIFLHKNTVPAACLHGLPFDPEKLVTRSSEKVVYIHQTTRRRVPQIIFFFLFFLGTTVPVGLGLPP